MFNAYTRYVQCANFKGLKCIISCLRQRIQLYIVPYDIWALTDCSFYVAWKINFKYIYAFWD